MARTLDQISQMIRRRLGWPTDDTFVTDEELYDMIRESRQELFDLLISIHQGDYRTANAVLTTVADQPYYLLSPNNPSSVGTPPDLQADFARIRRVSLIIDNVSVPMRHWDVESDVEAIDSRTWDRGTDVRYRITAGYLDGELEKLLWFNPTPAGEYRVLIWGNVGLSVTTFSATDSVNMIGNDEYLVLDGMLKCLQMEETDTSTVERQKARYIEMLTNNQPPIDAGQPAVIQDARANQLYGDLTDRWYR